jgi:hypothetical protein
LISARIIGKNPSSALNSIDNLINFLIAENDAIGSNILGDEIDMLRKLQVNIGSEE